MSSQVHDTSEKIVGRRKRERNTELACDASTVAKALQLSLGLKTTFCMRDH